MTWGTGPWGSGSPWGVGALVTLPPPSLVATSSEPGPIAPASGPAVIACRGGTICRIVGTNFVADEVAPYVQIDFLIGTGGSYTQVGTGYVFDPTFDVSRNRLTFGSPRLEPGLYHVQVTTPGGASGVLEDAFAARYFADEYKTTAVRGKFSPKWATGPRILRGS